MVHDIYLAYHIFRFRGNMGLSKFVLIFTVLKLMNQIKFYCQKKTPMTGITLYIAKQTAEFYKDQTVSQG